jgi:hypothetical protein
MHWLKQNCTLSHRKHSCTTSACSMFFVLLSSSSPAVLYDRYRSDYMLDQSFILTMDSLPPRHVSSLTCDCLTGVTISHVNTTTTTKQLSATTLLYVCVNFVSLYSKYLTDCAQRNAFLETRRSMETRYKIEKENAKQVRH